MTGKGALSIVDKTSDRQRCPFYWCLGKGALSKQEQAKVPFLRRPGRGCLLYARQAEGALSTQKEKCSDDANKERQRRATAATERRTKMNKARESFVSVSEKKPEMDSAACLKKHSKKYPVQESKEQSHGKLLSCV